MVNTSNEFTRRILNFPAIRPCETVSFPTILTSLISLAHKICHFKSRTFSTNKRNARNSIRLIENLVVFMEEISSVNPRFEACMVLSLSELHFVFQKIHFLLEDCVRDDARLWMLMKSEKVSTHFRVLMRAVGVALDVLPLEELEVSTEVKELVELVKKQALTSKFVEETCDDMIKKTVFRVMDQFEGGVAPESSDLERVLEHLEIRRWNECNKEVKFLENETGQECLTAEKRDFVLLSSLMAFLIYCRCTVFLNHSESVAISQQYGGVCAGEVIKYLNPDDFRCPISLEIMSDPVTISTGHTYDRAPILKWFGSRNHTCPKTGERLIRVDFVPNLAMKRLIKQYCQEYEIPFAESSGLSRDITRSSADAAGSMVAEQVMKLLAKFLVSKLIIGTDHEQQKSAYEIRLLTKRSIFNRSCLVESIAIPPLLDLLRSINPEAQENAMAALLNLAKYSRSKKIVVEKRGLDVIINVLNHGLKPEACQHAAGALFYLASVEEYRRTIGRVPGTIPGLMGLIWDGPDRGKKNALATILVLLMCPEHHWRVLSGGIVLLLVNLLTSSKNEDLITDSLAVLSSLAEKLDGAMAIISSGALPIIIEVLGSSNSKPAKEYCVSLLLALCINDGADVVPLLVQNTSLIMALYSLITEGTSLSGKKASSLIRILHAFDEKGSFRLVAPVGHQEHFVHVW